MPVYQYRCGEGHQGDYLLPYDGVPGSCSVCGDTNLVRVRHGEMPAVSSGSSGSFGHGGEPIVNVAGGLAIVFTERAAKCLKSAGLDSNIIAEVVRSDIRKRNAENN